jgi:5-methyltetrahydrofolate--homocysteine methyltransferase
MSADNPLHTAILTGKFQDAVALTSEAIDQGRAPEELVRESMIPAMDEVGRRFEHGEFFIPELMIAAHAMKKSMAIVRPLLTSTGVEPVGKAAVGTVAGDLHDIGKNLVASMLEGAGFEIIGLGVDVSAQQFVDAVRNDGAQIVCMSALLTTTMPVMADIIAAFNAAELRDRAKILVGGAPITQQYADEIGADGYGASATAAVSEARALLGIRA